MRKSAAAGKQKATSSGFPASAVGGAGNTVSVALKLRKYRDIQLKDVLEEKARGKWTDEDDKRWKKEKPYECSKCGERGSTRYNIETRHQESKHGVKADIKCPEADCDVVISRGRRDNLVKHLKKNHPTSKALANVQPGIGSMQSANGRDESKSETTGDLSRSQGKDQIDSLIEEFEKFPIADDLPTKPVHGLKRYYTREQLPFLPPEFLSHYADFYFAPTGFHPYLPFLHYPSFRPNLVLASFLRSVCAIGGLYDPTNKTLRSLIWESGWRVLERWIEPGPEDEEEGSPQKTDGTMRSRAGSSTGHTSVIDRELFEIDTEVPPLGFGATNTVTSSSIYAREGSLSVLQGLLLFAAYGLTAADKEKHRKGRRLYVRCVEIAREHNYFRPMPYPATDGVNIEHQWEIFIEQESRKRIAFAIFLLDCHTALIFNTPCLLRTAELRQLPLPCADALFGARSAVEWARIRANYSEDHGYFAEYLQPTSWTAFKSLLVNQEDTQHPSQIDHTFGGLILMVAFHAEIVKFTRRVTEEVEFFVVTDGGPAAELQHGLGGVGLVVFPRYHQADVEGYRNCLNTLGQRYGRSLFTEELPSNEAFHRPKLEGCDRMFYMTYHLSHIQLYVPDRVIIYEDGIVPTSLETALNDMAQCARKCAYDENTSSKELFLEMLEKTKVLTHLLEVLRFLIAPYTTYDEDDRFSEFPVVAVLIFKALLVAWEILVRTAGDGSQGPGSSSSNETLPLAQATAVSPLLETDPLAWNLINEQLSDDKREIGNPWGLDKVDNIDLTEWASSTGPVLAPQTPDVHGSTATNSSSPSAQTATRHFREGVARMLETWENLTGDTDGFESLEWRFLRCVRGILADMECWDVGKAAASAVDGLFLG